MVLKGIERDTRALTEIFQGRSLQALYDSLPNESNAQELIRYIRAAEKYQDDILIGKLDLLSEEGFYLVVGVNENQVGVATLLHWETGIPTTLLILCRDASGGVGLSELDYGDVDTVVRWGVIKSSEE